MYVCICNDIRVRVCMFYLVGKKKLVIKQMLKYLVLILNIKIEVELDECAILLHYDTVLKSKNDGK